MLHGIGPVVASKHISVKSTPRRVLENKMNGQENKNNRDTTMENSGNKIISNIQGRIVWLLIAYMV